MRILIASDIHGAPDSVLFLQKKVELLKPDLCILLGDFLYHGPRNPLPKGYSTKDVADMLANLDVKILALRGNCDAEVDESLLSFPLVDQSWVYADNLCILASHGHRYDYSLPNFTNIPTGSIILTGHTHVPRGESYKHVYWWNPGSISLPKQSYPRSYGFYEQGQFSVFDMQDKCFLSHKVHMAKPA